VTVLYKFIIPQNYYDLHIVNLLGLWHCTTCRS